MITAAEPAITPEVAIAAARFPALPASVITPVDNASHSAATRIILGSP